MARLREFLREDAGLVISDVNDDSPYTQYSELSLETKGDGVVLQNTRRHATTERTVVDPTWIDPRSSARWFDGWRKAPGEPARADAGEPTSPGERPTSPPRTWLLSTGWRRCGLIRVDEVPAAAFR